MNLNQNKFTFKSKNLVVDWISFKFQHLEQVTMKQIADYLFTLGFNSYQESGKLAKPIRESIRVDPNNQSQVIFVVDNVYWKGTILNFSGRNAASFYYIITQQIVSWKLFSSATLGRFDIYYSRKNKIHDNSSVMDFFQNCHTKIAQTSRNVNIEKNNKGLILKIGSRKSNHYFRIYQDKNSLKFEYEMKGQFLRKLHLLLVSNRLEEFESNLSQRFLCSLGKRLPLHYSYLDWLVVQLRPIRKKKLFSSTLRLDYLSPINSSSDIDCKNFFNFLQFIVYAENLDYEPDSLGSTKYRRVVFSVQDFLKYKKESDNYYQLNKLLKFFNELQNDSVSRFFSDNQYRSLISIPEVNLEKGKQNSWIAKIWIAEDLFSYLYPFVFPDILTRKLKKYEMEVQFKIIQVFASVSITKTFYIRDFLNNYTSTLNNKQKTQIKKYFIQLIQTLKEADLITSDYMILSNGKLSPTDQLTPFNISEGFTVQEHIFLDHWNN